MKKNFKKALSLVLAVLMAMAVVPFSGMAVEETCNHSYSYTSSPIAGKHYKTCTLCYDNELVNCSRESDATVTCGSPAICDYCDSVFGTVDHVFDSKIESAETLVAGDVTCNEYKSYYYTCSVCNEISETATFVSETTKGDVHAFTNATKKYLKEAVCEGNPVYYYECARCNVSSEGFTGATYTDETVVIEHMFVALEVPSDISQMKDPATCTSPAVFYKVCNECGESAKGIDETATYEFGPKEDHKFTEKKIEKKYLLIPATCSEGSIYSMSCKDCGASAVAAGGVSRVEGEYTLAEGETYNAFRADDARRHDQQVVTKEAKEPTCTAEGWTEEVRCGYDDCKGTDGGNTILAESEKKAALGHDYSTTPEKEYIAPTCKQYGQYGQVKCLREDCGKTFYVNEKGEMMTIDNVASFVFAIEPLGHIDENNDEVCDRPNCNGHLTPEDLCECICHSSGFLYFIAWILKFFWQLTGSRPYCECGITHYAVD